MQNTSLQLPTFLDRSFKKEQVMLPMQSSIKPAPNRNNIYIECKIAISTIPRTTIANPKDDAMGQVIAKHSVDMSVKKTKRSRSFFSSSYFSSDMFSVYSYALLLF